MAKILIVDDSETQRFALRQDLEKAGYEVTEAANGHEGLEKLSKNLDIALIISDVNMPVMDGITMCTKLKELGSHAGIPIFMLTSEATPELKDRSKGAGVTAWIVKPYVGEKIVSAARKVIKQ